MAREQQVDVLIVEDQGDVAQSTAAVLEYGGLTTVIVATMEEARAYVEAAEVSSVLLDHQLAEEPDGELEDRLAGFPPVIVVSGLGRDLLDHLKAKHGESLYAALSKPVPPERLIELFREVVGKDVALQIGVQKPARARVFSFRAEGSDLTELVTVLETKLIEAYQGIPGFRGLYVLEHKGRVLVVAFWEDDSGIAASKLLAYRVADHIAKMTRTVPLVEVYQVEGMLAPPAP
jgi:CheY-like chemotaxis protein